MDRCWWCGTDPLYVAYHDDEWGQPVHDDLRLFEMLVLEGFQAGLSWITILRKREAFRAAFDGFDPRKVAVYDEADIERLLGDAGIVRNKAKVRGAVTNARAFLAVQDDWGSFDDYIWSFTGGETLRDPAGMTQERLPATTELAQTLSKDLKARGFVFVGPTVVYAHMQATGMVDDHVEGCFRYVPR